MNLLKKLGIAMMLLTMVFAFAGCGGSGGSSEGEGEEQAATEAAEKTEVKVFAAASMQSSLEELEKNFEAENPDVDILLNCDSSGTLKTQIEEGAPCDVFFSAAQKQMDELAEKGLVNEESRQNVLNNPKGNLLLLNSYRTDTIFP